MAIIVKPFPDFEPGTTAESSKVNADFNTLYTEFNGGIDDANIAPVANIAQSKIAGLQADIAFINTPAPLRVVAKQTAEQGVTNTAVETALYAETIAGGTLGTNNFIHGEVDIFIISILNGATVSIKLYFGGTGIIFAPIANNSGGTVTNVGARIDFRIHSRGSTVSQSASATAFLASSSLFFGGITNLFNFTGNPTSIAVDSAVNQTLQLNALWSAASPDNSVFGLGLDVWRVA